MKTIRIGFALLLATALTAAAQIYRPVNSQPSSPTVKGAVLGAIAGAVVGNNTGGHNAGKGAAIGAAIGFVAGSVAQTQPQNRTVPVYVSNGFDSFGSGSVPYVSERNYCGNCNNSFYGSSGPKNNPRERALTMAVQEANNARQELEYAQQQLEDAKARLALAATKCYSADAAVRALQR